MRKKKSLLALVILILCVSIIEPVYAVTPSYPNYNIQVYDDTEIGVYICNRVPVKEVGDEVYLTYTVANVGETHTAAQHGVVATDTYSLSWPYLEGGLLKYDDKVQMLDESYTYFYKFVYTGNGFDVMAGRAKDEESEYFGFIGEYGDGTDDYKYFGVWFSNGVSDFQLTNARCYDENGKDLGINISRQGRVMEDLTLKSNSKLNHYYSVKVEPCGDVALSNAKRALTDEVYLEYKVKSDKSKLIQSGAGLTISPLEQYPHGGAKGVLSLDQTDEPEQSYLLQPGATYIVRYAKKEDYLDVFVQRSYQGKTESYTFAYSWGDYIKDAEYVYLWFGSGPDYLAAFELENFRFYDANGKDLGVQCNQAPVTSISHFGELDDYTGCEALYYNEESEGVIALYADQRVKITENGQTTDGSYIVENVERLILNCGGTQKVNKYYYEYIETEDGTIYKRLKDVKVTFVADGEKRVVDVNADSGFRVEKPENPKKDGAKFIGWQRSDGSEFDFDKLVTSSATLYAQFDRADEYPVGKVLDWLPDAPYLIAGIAILLAGGACSVILLRKGKKYEEK